MDATKENVRKERVVARVLMSPTSDIYHIIKLKVDEKAEIYITTGILNSPSFSGHLMLFALAHVRSAEYDDRYLVFDTDDFESDVKEVRRMASDIATVNGLLPIRLRTINRWLPCPLMPQTFRPATCLG